MTSSNGAQVGHAGLLRGYVRLPINLTTPVKADVLRGEGLAAGSVDARDADARSVAQGDSYRVLSDVYHQFLSEQTLEVLLEKIAEALDDLVAYDTLTIYEADEAKRELIPVLSRDRWEKEIMATRPIFGQGITGWAVANRQPVLANEAHLDPRVTFVPGTPMEPEALISVPLIARGAVKGALNIYRQDGAKFSDEEFHLAKTFADAAALALDNAHIRAALEHQAQTDSLTGLYNHRFFQERLRSEINRASRAHDSVALMMFDIDDFKKLNDVHGHAVGDQVLVGLADILRTTVRSSDLPCRIGGEEFAVILPSCDSGDAIGFARRLRDRLAVVDFESTGQITISVGVAQGPEHAMSPRELVACSEAAMMTAKARGKNQSVLYDEHATERPTAVRSDLRSIAHLKMLQSLAGKLNRLNDMRQIAETIANELRTLIDYHSCRVYLTDGEDLVPIAIRGDLSIYGAEMSHVLAARFGEGVTGRAASTGRAILVPNSLECDFAVHVPGTDEIEESLIAVPMLYGARVNGVVTISKLGKDQVDEDDVRLLEVLAGQASVALENARLYEAQRREAENARALLKFAERVTKPVSISEIAELATQEICRMVDIDQSSVWIFDETMNVYTCLAHEGYLGDPASEPNVRMILSKEEAQTLLRSARLPFVISAEEILGRVPRAAGLDLKTVAIAPLLDGEMERGWVCVRSKMPNVGFSEEKLLLLAGIAHQISVAMQKADLYRDQKETADIARSLLKLSSDLSSAETMDEIMQRVVERAAVILGSPRTWVWLQEPETGDLVPEAWWGISEEEREQQSEARFSADVVEPFLARATEPFVIEPDDYAHLVQLDNLQSGLTHAIAPLKMDGRLGCIVVAAPALGTYTFSERKMRLLAGIADQAKLALNNANNFEILESTFLSTIEALANALEAKDEYTSSHTRSIVEMSLEVGEEMGLDNKTLKRLEMGALFHDIGKIGIPSDILLKPGPLTDAEREVMNTHPELGERILAPIDRLEEVRPIVRACHEHFDGSGYPDKKSGDHIPVEARVILVCDAYDAMTTDRPYRKRLSSAEACRRIKASAGRQFDPEVVDVFLRLVSTREGFVGT